MEKYDSSVGKATVIIYFIAGLIAWPFKKLGQAARGFTKWLIELCSRVYLAVVFSAVFIMCCWIIWSAGNDFGWWIHLQYWWDALLEWNRNFAARL